MLEKNSILHLTYEEKAQIEQGQIPDRIAQEWGLSLEALRDILASHRFVIV